ncbi:MAG: glycosyl transferase [Solirubrobacterales bacterium]|nr:glycosyl transferase [Solirubrobacterales bacterium]
MPGVATELMLGLAELGHQIDCYLAGRERAIPDRVAKADGVTFHWGTGEWRWGRWYNRTVIGSFVSGLLTRALGSFRLRRSLARGHAIHPYDVIYQFSSIEALGMPASLRHSVPLVIHPETHIEGELRHLLAERTLALRCQPAHVFALTAGVMWLRVFVQRRRIRAARLLICISTVFRDHLVRDYRFPLRDTVVIPNPVRLARFAASDTQRAAGQPPTVLVLGRISARKGIEDVIAMAWLLHDRGVDARIRIVGGPSLWSDYSKLLADLPPESSEFVGRIAPADIPAELARADVLVQASRYEPFGLTVGEALAAGVPVVATSEVGAIEDVDRAVVTELAPGDVEGLAAAVVEMLERLTHDAPRLRAKARAEAQRRFAPDVVCRQVSDALLALSAGDAGAAGGAAGGAGAGGAAGGGGGGAAGGGV